MRPCSSARISGRPSRYTAISEFVVPRSMPTISSVITQSPLASAPALLTITSAARSSSSSHRKPALTSSTTMPEPTVMSCVVPTTRPMRGSNRRPIISIRTTRRSARMRSSRRSVMPRPSRQLSGSACRRARQRSNQRGGGTAGCCSPAASRSRRSSRSSSNGRSNARPRSRASACARFSSCSSVAWLDCSVSKTPRNWSSASFTRRDSVRTSLRSAASSTKTVNRSASAPAASGCLRRLLDAVQIAAELVQQGFLDGGVHSGSFPNSGFSDRPGPARPGSAPSSSLPMADADPAPAARRQCSLSRDSAALLVCSSFTSSRSRSPRIAS